MNYDGHPRVPDEMHTDKPTKDIERAMTKAKTCLRNAQHRQKQIYDSRHGELEFNIGDNVGDKAWLKSKIIQGLRGLKGEVHEGISRTLSPP